MEDNRRVIIVDVSHLFYKYAFGMGATNLTATIMVDGVPTVVDTKIPSMTIKQIHRLANGGVNPTVICFDSKGCANSRKAYFAQKAGVEHGKAQGYKGSRDSQNEGFYKSINMTMNILYRGGVNVLRADKFEADDLVYIAVKKAKQQYPNLPIHVITGDADLVPLVDNQVSVFYSSRKTTYAVKKEWEITHYVQITPDTYEQFMSDITAFKNIPVPYNTIILAKCLRGDKSDEIAGYPKFTPTKYAKLITDLRNGGVDIGNLFRYDDCRKIVYNRVTHQIIPENEWNNYKKEDVIVQYKEPQRCEDMCNILRMFLDEDIVEHVRFVYNGINLNTAFTGIPDRFCRNSVQMSGDIKPYVAGQLQQVASELRINLPLMKQ